MTSYNIKALTYGQVLPSNTIEIPGYGRVTLVSGDPTSQVSATTASVICSSAVMAKLQAERGSHIRVTQ